MTGRGDLYAVENIIGKKNIGGRVHYLVKWKGYPEDEATWEKVASLKYVKPMIMQYNARLRTGRMQEESRRSSGELLERRISAKRHEDERDGELGKDLSMQNHFSRTAPASRVLGNSANGISILSLLENELMHEQEKEARANQKQVVHKREEREGEKEKERRDRSVWVDEGYNEDNLFFSMEDEPQKMKVSSQKQPLPTPRKVAPKNCESTTVGDLSNLAEGRGVRARRAKERATRMSAVKRKDKQGVEYFMEDQKGNLRVFSGREMIARHPEEFLTFVENIINKFLP